MATNKYPYKLPEKIVIDPADLDEYGLPKYDKLYALITDHGTRMRRYDYLENLYYGFHDILHQPEKPKWKPDWRLAVNFPHYLTETFVAYGYGNPAKITHESPEITADIKKFLDRNDFSGFLTEIITACAVYGHAWAYVYQDENARTNITCFTPKQMFCVYDDTLKKRALFSVRYGRHTVGRYTGELYGEVVSPNGIRHFDHGSYVDDVQPNPWGRINAVEWMLNDHRIGLYEMVTALIEAYDHALSEKSNDVDSFAEAVLAVIGAEVDPDDLENARDKRIINLFGTDDAKNAVAQYLAKPVADGTQENLLDRLERLIYQISMVANISDDTFGSSTSGTALSYKLWSTSNVVQKCNTRAEKSIKKIFKLWASFATNTSRPDMYDEIKVQFIPNIPRNEKEETDTARSAEGIVSKRTQLSLLSYVSDPDAEIERMEKEREEMAAAIDSYVSAVAPSIEGGDA